MNDDIELHASDDTDLVPLMRQYMGQSSDEDNLFDTIDTTLRSRFWYAVKSDVDGGSYKEFFDLTAWYLQLSEAERAIVDRTLVHVCGWSLKTLLRRNPLIVDEDGQRLEVT